MEIERRKLTVPQVAKLWGVSTKKVNFFVRTGQLKAINLASNTSNRPRYSVDLCDIAAFEQTRRVVPDGGESTTRKLRRLATGNVKQFF
jgi:hypothetical protein